MSGLPEIDRSNPEIATGLELRSALNKARDKSLHVGVTSPTPLDSVFNGSVVVLGDDLPPEAFRNMGLIMLDQQNIDPDVIGKVADNLPRSGLVVMQYISSPALIDDENTLDRIRTATRVLRRKGFAGHELDARFGKVTRRDLETHPDLVGPVEPALDSFLTNPNRVGSVTRVFQRPQKKIDNRPVSMFRE